MQNGDEKSSRVFASTFGLPFCLSGEFFGFPLSFTIFRLTEKTMDLLQDLALCVAAFGTLVWLSIHPSKCQRERAKRTQELRDWDWRA